MLIQRVTSKTVKTLGGRTSLYSISALSITLEVKDENGGPSHHVTITKDDLNHCLNLIKAREAEIKARL